jgi:hypothetical protein
MTLIDRLWWMLLTGCVALFVVGMVTAVSGNLSTGMMQVAASYLWVEAIKPGRFFPR